MKNINHLINEIEQFLARIDKGVVKAQEAGDFFVNSIREAKEIFIKDSDEWRLLDRWENESGYVWHPVYKSGVYADEKLKLKINSLLNKIKEIKNIPITDSQEKINGTPRIIYLKMLYGDDFIDYIKDEVGVDNFLKDIFERQEKQKNDFILNDKRVSNFFKQWAILVHKYKNLYGQSIRDKDAIDRLIATGIIDNDSLYSFRNKLFKSDFNLDESFMNELDSNLTKLNLANSKLDLPLKEKDKKLINSKVW